MLPKTNNKNKNKNKNKEEEDAIWYMENEAESIIFTKRALIYFKLFSNLGNFPVYTT